MIKWLLIALVIIVVAVLFIFQPHSKLELKQPVKIVLFGDSIAYGIGSIDAMDLQYYLQQDLGYEIKNLGTPGDTTSDGLDRLNQISNDTSLVIMSLGGNDLLKRINPEVTYANLDTIVKELKKQNIVVILLDISAPIFASDYQSVFSDIGKNNKNVIVVDKALSGITGNRELSADPRHPNSSGYEVLSDRIASIIWQKTDLIKKEL